MAVGLVALVPVDPSPSSVSSLDASSPGQPASTPKAAPNTTCFNEPNRIDTRVAGRRGPAQVLSATVGYCPHTRKPRCTIVPFVNTKNEVSYFSSVA